MKVSLTVYGGTAEECRKSAREKVGAFLGRDVAREELRLEARPLSTEQMTGRVTQWECDVEAEVPE